MSGKEMRTLGEIIKDDMKARNINGSAVARKMKIARQTINQIDTKKTFDLTFLQKLKDASGLDYTNYFYNPKTQNYEELIPSSNLEEPAEGYGNSIELSLSLKIRAQEDDLTQLGQFIAAMKEQAKIYGFTLK